MIESRMPARAEPLGIGERLRNAREAKGLSLRTVADMTRIRAVYLQALEEERFDQLPGAVYTRGFLRTYADALGLDADRLMDAYPGAFEPPGPSLIGTAGVEIPIRPAAPRSRLRLVATYVAAVLGIMLVAFAVIGYRQLREFNESVPPEAVAPQPGPAAPPEASPVIPPSSPAPTSPSVPAPTPDTAPEPPPVPVPAPVQPPIALPEPPPTPPEPPQPAVIDGVTVEVQARGTSWLRVTADGERAFVGYLHDGDARTWQAKRRLTIRIGNAPAVSVLVNGRPITPPAGRRVWEQTFTKQ